MNNDKQELNRQDLLMELLAARDGEPFDAQLLNQLTEDEQRQLLLQVDEVHSELNSLPDVPVNDDVWRQHMHSHMSEPSGKPPLLGQHQSHWLRFPMATAASVFLVSAVGMFVLFSGNNQAPESNDFVVTGAQIDSQGLALANLMTRSRDLEQRLSGMSGWVNAVSDSGPAETSANAQIPMSPAERVLLYRLADVDGQIGRLYESEQVDQATRLQLWRQRVDLLENLVVMRGSRQGVRSIYMNDGRSM